ncbi:ergosterol biosynthesis protein-like protein [Cucurbitaria berberidis CBS 394.84]|uniref:Ergosterol biosynthesis protein-like protein n=1 Tax=Cucurbitaria berberidis CBS 394.84 TaxID=1168544 RepID=A0A9P4GDQ7_9PLEO|nr:ergosterol biosynthesis protein-like protein [Cucurbitaria berberidis CBS 394.84]KAF1843446.1 ergosterol biosynthesis protein-like protein [Cucurbitaria berberidis CBS 394.84]
MASTVLSYLPPAEGLLPKWLLMISLLSVGNSVQAYTTLHFTSRVYNPSAIDPPPQTPKHVTGLSSRTFGTWTFLTSLVRLYAAYNITNGAFYQLAMWTFVVAWGHFLSEWLVFKTTKWGMPLAGPIIVSNASLLWMLMQWGYYVKV